MLLRAMNSGTNIGIAEFATHGGLTIAFFALAGLGAYALLCCDLQARRLSKYQSVPEPRRTSHSHGHSEVGGR
jgi:hypothetical protein